ncbi:hypothetical protein CKO44_12865 [Rubrivivax gelatinosus]|nr:hypothetical protein [Rubrivivax gelatinosus]
MAGGTPAAHELRVLDGPQRGARFALEAGRDYRIGRHWGSDVLLRAGGADSADAAELVLRLQADGRLQLQVTAGSVCCGRRRLAAGQSLLLAPLQALEIDGTRLAAGPADSAAWPELENGGAMPAAAPAPAVVPDRLRRWGRGLRIGGAALAAASLSLLALAMLTSPAAPTAQQRAQRAQALLASAGLGSVSVTAEADGLVVRGYFDTLAQRSRAEQLLAGQGLGARLDVWVNETIVHTIEDVYRVHGVQAEVRPAGAGVMQVHTAVADPAPLAGIERRVRGDVPGLQGLQAVNEPPRRSPSPVPALEDAGKRVASIVAGSEPYVVTADGTRYFVGALLPTGHRIEAIAGSRVELEREGERSAIVF